MTFFRKIYCGIVEKSIAYGVKSYPTHSSRELGKLTVKVRG